jgi:hypothetical protein
MRGVTKAEKVTATHKSREDTAFSAGGGGPSWRLVLACQPAAGLPEYRQPSPTQGLAQLPTKGCAWQLDMPPPGDRLLPLAGRRKQGGAPTLGGMRRRGLLSVEALLCVLPAWCCQPQQWCRTCCAAVGCTVGALPRAASTAVCWVPWCAAAAGASHAPAAAACKVHVQPSLAPAAAAADASPGSGLHSSAGQCMPAVLTCCTRRPGPAA